MSDDDEPQEEETLVSNVQVIIPICCREGREDCPHAIQKQRPDKRNIGL